MAMKDVRAEAQKSASAKIGKMAGGDHKGAVRSKYGADPKGYLAGGLVRPQAPAPMPAPAAGRAMPPPMPMAAPAGNMPMAAPAMPPSAGMGPMLARAKGGAVKAGAGSGVGRLQHNKK